MDNDTSHGGEVGELVVEDEFACAGMLRGSLTSLHSSVERIFRVSFGIETDDLPHGSNGQIWLKLRGLNKDVSAAKSFVKGLVNQERQQEVSYPGSLHCVFCGARGLFMDCLIKNTSAHIVVGSPGFLLISGLMEPVVQAYSLITDLVERYESTQSRRSETGDRGFGESLESRRAFKSLVEKWEDRHTLDLLVLPGSVKEILLDLVRESGLDSSQGLEDFASNGAGHSQRISKTLIHGSPGTRLSGESGAMWDNPSSTAHTIPGSYIDNLGDAMTGVLGAHAAGRDPHLLSFSSYVGTQRRAAGVEERQVRSPQEVGEEGQPDEADQWKMEHEKKEDVSEEEGELLLSVGSKKEFGLLLKFFTAMGYTENVVRRVLARTGPKEASQILDLVQQEQDHNDQDQKRQQARTAQNQSERNRPCETEHRERDRAVGGAGKGASAMSSNGGMGAEARKEIEQVREEEEGAETKEMREGRNEEDFVLGVLKRAAASCGYTEEKVAEVYGMLPDAASTHQLLLQLQREGAREAELQRTDLVREGPREVDDVVLERVGRRAANDVTARPFTSAENWADDRGRVENITITDPERDLFPWQPHAQQLSTNESTSRTNQHQLSKPETPHQTIPPEVRGPPLPTYPPSLDPNPQPAHFPKQPKAQLQVVPPPYVAPFPPAVSFDPPRRPNMSGDDSSSAAVTRKWSFPANASGVVVTGEQRFLEGLQTPFKLKLTDGPEDPELTMIIIDGSNVAMSHGLGHFFSCRGIALAVQHFWNRGHRRISVLLPQWRQKRDPKIKEQHYLNELHELGLLSYTPSREVEGKRINAYDDRFMLQLAQQSGGVIVTNDNLRDLLVESLVWKDIIKKRLLQYTFVGDHFMVPDDPLGRGGPHLDDFLRSKHRPPDPGNHSFAGTASNFPPSKSPRSQTELLHFRDRTPVGAPEPEPAGRRGKGRGQGRGGHQQRQRGGGGAGMELDAVRSPEETARLREALCQVFPGQESMVTLVLQSYATERDINALSDLMLEEQRN
ncbi:protein KHNYN [Myripristis murdjan]|uniref:protein KHNYN n=1 Tax=Myripristis murdjan TaxID=586833 RepID=UPI00117602DA|nr:protein KHNYN-like [Myripristis murdjan]XP_029932059.1 protein KHNYN-like [Myripristis murdjan]XP_029932060.1 protein KHNYN-like [Myripristis murdjan]XP_029932061.1 protein KHNYN-like [Myripristis murdjan]XP_029932062.1 protein KHNYN-like [Myripristis murdjan]